MVAPGLVVPIRLEALLIGDRDTSNNGFLPAHADFSRLPRRGAGTLPWLGDIVVNRPFTGDTPMAKGIHLHWWLPKALRQGQTDESGKLTMPEVPNRWLVVRTVSSRTADPVLTAWVVESDFVAAQPTWSRTSVPWKTQGGSDQPYRYQGRVYPLADWLAGGERGDYVDGLTTIGAGLPDFATFYPNCVNVFGFCDDGLNDGFDTAQTLGYSVTGWYSNPDDDPLKGAPISGADNPFKWTFADSPAGKPNHTLFHGRVGSLPWNPAQAYFPDFATPIGAAAALGNTTMEAFSALAARRVQGSTDVQQSEYLLNAIQLGLQSQFSQPDGLAKVEEALFNASFRADSDESLWDIIPPPAAPDAKAAAATAADVPDGLAGRLSALNGLQRRRNALTRRQKALRGQIFADWVKYIQKLHPSSGPADPQAGDIYRYVSREITALGTLAADIATLDGTIDTAAADIRALLPATLSLVTTTAPRYYGPTDPVLLLQGDGVPSMPEDQSATTIACVTTDTLPTAMTLPAGLVTGSAAVTLPASALPTVPAASGSARLSEPLAVAQALTLADPSAPVLLAHVLASAGGAGNPAVIDRAATESAIAAALSAILGGTKPSNGIAVPGTLPRPAIALRSWATPWLPIALAWSCVVRPLAAYTSAKAYTTDFVTAHFALDADSFNLAPTTSAFADAVQAYSGHVLLSPAGSVSLQQQIADYLKNVDDPDLKALLEQLKAYPLLSQELSGFHSALLMREQTLQLPVADPIAPDRSSSTFSNVTVPPAVGTENDLAPLVDATYNPLRAGQFTIDRLRLVDSFGRFRPIDLADMIVAETIQTMTGQTTAGAAATGSQAVVLPLRVAQPVRLGFRWLSAADPSMETTSLPGTGPICGWVVPYHLGYVMGFYDADGSVVGTLTAAGEQLTWQTAPGAGPAGQSMADAFAGRNAVLAAYALDLGAAGADHLRALLDVIDETRVFVAPTASSKDVGTAVLLGSPLAIVQADLSLTLAGPPAPEQGMAALTKDMANGDPTVRSTAGFPDVRFPVALGSFSRLNDGLIGYFLCGNDGKADHTAFYAAAATAETGRIRKPAADTITLAPDDAGATRVAMLVDPRCSVSACCGIAPVKTLTVPSDASSQATDTMTYTFLTAPVLTPTTLTMPLPTEATGTWSWATYGNGQWTETDAITAVNQTANLPQPQRIVDGWLKLTNTTKK